MSHENTVKQAGGFIIQLMPFTSDETIAKLEENLAKVDSVTSLLDKGLTPEELLRTVLEGFDVEINDTMPVQFHCDCSKEKVEKVLISIGKKDLQEMINDGKDVEVNCQFCNKNYKFSVEELKKLLVKAKK